MGICWSNVAYNFGKTYYDNSKTNLYSYDYYRTTQLHVFAYTIGITFLLQINSIVYIIIVHQVFKTKHDANTVDEADIVESVK